MIVCGNDSRLYVVLPFVLHILLAALTESELCAMIAEPAHRRILLNAIEYLKLALALRRRDEELTGQEVVDGDGDDDEDTTNVRDQSVSSSTSFAGL